MFSVIALHKPWKPAKECHIWMPVCIYYYDTMKTCTGMIPHQIQMRISEDRWRDDTI